MISSVIFLPIFFFKGGIWSPGHYLALLVFEHILFAINSDVVPFFKVFNTLDYVKSIVLST